MHSSILFLPEHVPNDRPIPQGLRRVKPHGRLRCSSSPASAGDLDTIGCREQQLMPEYT